MTANRIDVVIIGAGQAGLAMSWCLTRRDIDHIVLEGGDVANSWRTERWDSLRLLTPNWFNPLPGWEYRGDDPDGYVDVANGHARFAGTLAHVSQAADLKLRRFLDEADRMKPKSCGEADDGPGWRPSPTVVDDHPVNSLPLDPVETVMWATGHRPHYPWIDARHRDARRRIHHVGGVLDQPGLYALGLPFTRRRKSALIGGVGRDAIELSAHLAGHLAETSRPNPSTRPPTRQAPWGR